MVREGYKHTDVGIIPNDWDIRYCPEICWFQEGPGLRKWQFKSQGIKVVNVTNLQDSGHLNLAKTSRHITWEEFNSMYQHFEIDEMDILIASSGNSYGKMSIARKRDLPLVMNTSVIRFKPKGDTIREYLWHFLKSINFKAQIDLMITGGAQPNFGPVHLKQVLVPYPNKKEQKAIAEALSDVDALIESLEKLIAKKRAIKTATMQELMTGKTRLPDFDGDWEEVKLESIADIDHDNLGSNTPDSYKLKYISLEQVNRGTLHGYEALTFSNSPSRARRVLKTGDVLFGTVRPNLQSHLLFQEAGNGWIGSTGFAVIRPKKQIANSRYLFELLFSYKIDKQIQTLLAGSNYPAISNKDVKALSVCLPPLPEQKPYPKYLLLCRRK